MRLRITIARTSPHSHRAAKLLTKGMRRAAHFDRDGLRLHAAALALLALAGCVGGANQGSVCRTNEDTLANLRDGMTYRQVVQVIGCEGTVERSATGDMVARWSGPGQSGFSATLVSFRNDRMIAFGVNGQ